MIDDPNGAAGLFLKYNYTETKDFAKAFLTLASGILAFSVTFSEKVIGFSTASKFAKLTICASWFLNVASIAGCGLALCYIALAGGAAVYGGDFKRIAETAYLMIIASGSLFVASLAALVASAIIVVLGNSGRHNSA